MQDQLFGGRYRLVRQLGAGAMGQVWQAQDEILDRGVAVKVISLLAGGGDEGREARARFLREAQTTARLQHPNIVTVHDFGETVTENDTVPFLVMELLRGRVWTRCQGALLPCLMPRDGARRSVMRWPRLTGRGSFTGTSSRPMSSSLLPEAPRFSISASRGRLAPTRRRIASPRPASSWALPPTWRRNRHGAALSRAATSTLSAAFSSN